MRVCADGGANRLFDLLDQSQLYIPAAVVGDLDSVRPEVVAFYRTAGVVLEAVEDQDRNARPTSNDRPRFAILVGF